MKSNECSEYSYIGLADFFYRKSSLNFSTLNFDFSRFDVRFFFKFNAFPLLKGRQTKKEFFHHRFFFSILVIVVVASHSAILNCRDPPTPATQIVFFS